MAGSAHVRTREGRRGLQVEPRKRKSFAYKGHRDTESHRISSVHLRASVLSVREALRFTHKSQNPQRSPRVLALRFLRPEREVYAPKLASASASLSNVSKTVSSFVMLSRSWIFFVRFSSLS